MFNMFKKNGNGNGNGKTPPDPSDSLAVVSDSITLKMGLVTRFKDAGFRCFCYTSDKWKELVDSSDGFVAVLVDLHLGAGLLAVEISKKLLMSAYGGNIVLLAGESMELYTERYATVLMLTRVMSDPMIVVRKNGITDCDRMAETAMLTQTICKGRR